MYDEFIRKINMLTYRDLIYKKDFEKMLNDIINSYKKGLLCYNEFIELVKYNDEMQKSIEKFYFLKGC